MENFMWKERYPPSHGKLSTLLCLAWLFFFFWWLIGWLLVLQIFSVVICHHLCDQDTDFSVLNCYLLYLQIGNHFLGAAKNLMFLKTVKKSVILLGGNMFIQNSISDFIIHKIAWSCIIQQYLTKWPPAAKVALMHLF